MNNIREYTPEQGSLSLNGTFTLESFTDNNGIVHFQGTETGQKIGIHETYNVIIDEKTGTFKLENATSSTGTPSSSTSSTSNSLLTTQLANEWTATVELQTHDPAQVPLCSTTLSYSWVYNANGSYTYEGQSLTPWAADPDILGTHWYCDYTYLAPPSNTAAGGSASYWNQDFLTPAYTYVTHTINIYPAGNGYYNYNWDFIPTGEAANLFELSVTAS